MGRKAKRAASRRNSADRSVSSSVSPVKEAKKAEPEVTTDEGPSAQETVKNATTEGADDAEEPSTPRLGRQAEEFTTPTASQQEVPAYFSPAARAFGEIRARPPAPPGTSPLRPPGEANAPGSAGSLALPGERERPRRASAPNLQLGGLQSPLVATDQVMDRRCSRPSTLTLSFPVHLMACCGILSSPLLFAQEHHVAALVKKLYLDIQRSANRPCRSKA